MELRYDTPLRIVGIMVFQDALDPAKGFIKCEDMCDLQVAHVRAIQSFGG